MIYWPCCSVIISYVFFSLQFRNKELALGQQWELKGIVGDAPYGIPVNIHIHGGCLVSYIQLKKIKKPVKLVTSTLCKIKLKISSIKP